MQAIKVTKPETIYIKFNGVPPRKFEVRDQFGKLYFERFLNGKTPRIKFNVPVEGVYTSTNDFEIVKRVSIEIPDLSFDLPPFERNRIKDFVIVKNPTLYNTPARVFTHEGVVEKSADFDKYPQPMRVFFLLHEVGHFYYKTESYCDLFALTHYLQMGYNMSTAMYCLTNVLRRTPANMDRVMFIYNNLFKNKN